MAAAPAVFVPAGTLAAGETVPLADGEARHLKVRRLRPGDPVVLLDGRGGRADGLLVAGLGEARVLRLLPPAGEPGARLFVALPCAEPVRVEWAVEKGTECGAAGFLLVSFDRSQRAHVAALGSRLERLRRIAAEATKQCGRSLVPPVAGPVPAEALGARASRLLLADPGAPLARAEALDGAADAVVVVGPEGGLSGPERERLLAAGSVPVGLGPRILRLETAVVALLTRLLES